MPLRRRYRVKLSGVSILILATSKVKGTNRNQWAVTLTIAGQEVQPPAVWQTCTNVPSPSTLQSVSMELCVGGPL